MKLLNDKDLRKLLDITDETLHLVILSELEKPSDDYDIELINTCVNILISRNEAKEYEKSRHKNYIPRKAIKPLVAIAVIASMLAATLFVADADIFMDLKHAIMTEFDRDKQIATIDPANSDTTPNGYALAETDLFKQIADLGITPVTLPEVLTNGEYIVSDIREVQTSSAENPLKQITFKFTKNKTVGAVTAIKSGMPYSNSDFLDIEDADEYAVNGMDVLLIKHKKSYSIHYYDSTQSVKYSISLVKCSDSEAEKIVESIK